MAAVSVTFDGTRVHNAESLTGTSGTVWLDWAGTATTLENDFKYQATYCVAELVKTTEHGVKYYDTAVSYNYASPVKVGIFKTIVTNYGVSNVKGATGMKICIGSSNLSNYYVYYISGSDTYPIRGGWLITPIDPNVAAYRDATSGTPVLTAVNFYAWIGTMTATAKSANFGFDAIDFIPSGKGLTLVGGDGASTDGTFTDFITIDEGTATNRWGVVSTLEGILYVTGVLTIGVSGSVTEFTDSNKTLVFPSGRFDTGFCGIDIGLQNTSTNVNITSCTFIGRGTKGTNDTRPDLGVTGISGVAIIDGCTFVSFNDSALTSKITLSNDKFIQCTSISQSGATITGCTFSSPYVSSSGWAFIKASNMQLISNCDFVSSGSGHAIEITTSGAYTFTGNTFTGYGADASGDASIFNNTSGPVNISIVNGGTMTIRNGGSATTSAVNAITVAVTVTDESSIPISGAIVAIYTSGAVTQIMNQVASQSGYAYVSYNYSSDTDIIVRVRKSSTGGTRYFPFNTSGRIINTGFNLSVMMVEDKIA